MSVIYINLTKNLMDFDKKPCLAFPNQLQEALGADDDITVYNNLKRFLEGKSEVSQICTRAMIDKLYTLATKVRVVRNYSTHIEYPIEHSTHRMMPINFN